MVHLASVPGPDDRVGAGATDDADALGPRARNRLARHRSYLEAALHIVFSDGLDALTMQRLADEVGASVGSVYTYFPSKGALVAEVQREAIERLATSAARLGDEIDRVTSPLAPLAAVAAFGRFWLSARETFPEEMQLLMLLLSDANEVIPTADATRVVPAAMRLLGLAESRIDVAQHRGLLSAGDADRRTIDLAAALTGCLQLSVIAHWDTELLDPVHAGRRVLDALLVAWGATVDDVAGANQVVDGLAARAPLARPLDGHQTTSPATTPTDTASTADNPSTTDTES